MQAVIMAGGKGTRLASITKDLIPKPMVNILGKPLLEWQIQTLKQYNIRKICLVIGHLGEKIQEYFGDGSDFGVQISYIQEKEPLGTAGSLYYIKEWLTDDSFFLIFGDVFFNIDLNRMLQFHISKDSIATLFVHPNSHPFDSDIVVMDTNERIERFDSKNNVRSYWYENCVNAGFYILNKRVCDYVTAPVKLDLEKNLLSRLIEEKQPVYGYRSPEYIKDIGTVDRINATIKDIESGFIDARCLSHKQKCIFLDRDGTINKYKGLLYNEDDFELETDVVEAIKQINHSEWLCIVVTNQPVVARGLCEIEDVENIHRKMATLLGKEGVYLDAVKYCPHHPDKGYPEENVAYKIKCHCRKPDIGMLLESAEEYNIDLKKSWMIGDTTIDIQTGINAGMHTALVLTGESGKDGKYAVQAEEEGKNLLEVVNKIIKR